MPRVSQDQLDARRQEILAGARACFARHGYEGATVRRLEEVTGLSRGAIFHHFRDKESLFLAVAEDDAATMVTTVAEHGLVQVMRDLLATAGQPEVAGWLGTQLEVSRRLRTDPAFAERWAARSAAIALALGATEAINLDGGGSTAMVVARTRGDSTTYEIVNRPSDAAGERPVGNALVIVRDRRGTKRC